MKSFSFLLLIFLLIYNSTQAYKNSSPVPVFLKVEDQFSPAAPGNVKISGYLGKKLDLCIKNRVMKQNIDHFVTPFRLRNETPWSFRGEFWGKWYTSAMLGYGYNPTTANRIVIDKAIEELITTQGADGYIGTSSAEKRINGVWDIWGRKYVLLGLIANYDQTGSKTILEAAVRAADALIREVGPHSGNNIAETGWIGWKGEASCSVLEPIVLLYQRTGEQRFLDFAYHIVCSWDTPNKLTPTGLRLIQDVLEDIPMRKLGGAPKAYEMMSCFEGLCELYRSTGNRYYLDACIRLAKNIFQNEITIIGSGSMAEIWNNTRFRQTEPMYHAMETCVTVTWIKFLYQLLRLTGESFYADQMETALYNALLASMTPDGSWWSYFTGMMGERTVSHLQFPEMASSCCVANGPRALLLTPYWAVMRDPESIIMNLYAPMQLAMETPLGQPLSIRVETEYPKEGKITLQIRPIESELFTVRLRIPFWSRENKLLINGIPYEGYLIPGTYAVIKRIWNPDDTIELTLDMRTRILQAPNQTGDQALCRGPLVFAFDSRLQEPQPDPKTPPMYRYDFMPNANDARYIDAEIIPSPKKEIYLTLKVPVRDEAGTLHELLMCDFTSAGNLWGKGNIFRTWIPQPFDVRHLYIKLDWKANCSVDERPEIPEIYKITD